MPRWFPNSRLLLLLLALAGATAASAGPTLETGWENPPPAARLRAYWWWLNGNVTKAAITRDLEGMQAKGFGGALICDANGAAQEGNDPVPHGPTFGTPAWRELYRHTLSEAHRLGLELSLNIQSGWNLGGPMVAASDAPKKLVWTNCVVTGPQTLTQKLELPPVREGYYRDLFVVACRLNPNNTRPCAPLQNWREKALLQSLQPFSAPDTAPLLAPDPPQPGDPDTHAAEVLDLTPQFVAGKLTWQVPAGRWEIFRFGCTLNEHCRVSTCSDGWNGYAIDPFDAGAFQRYWNAVVEPLIADAGPLAGTTLKYLHTDSWEVEVANWTPTLRAEFRQRRGYDLLPWLPVVAGRIVNSREESDRFLNDFRRTFGDLAIDHHYRLFREFAHRHGLLIHPESGGPHAVPIDAQQCLGFDDAPMSEFWAWSWTHRIGDANRFFVKQPASAAHTYGHNLVLAEGFTTIGPHWQERLWDNLKPAFDHACTEGLNRLVWHAFVCSPAAMGLPGQQYFAGTHLNPNVTWWDKSGPFFAYINRTQWMLQQGHFVADALYYYGNQVPNFAQLRSSDPAQLGPGYDYDVVTEEALLTRTTVYRGRIELPDGMSYRVLVLPNYSAIALPVLRKVRELVAAGATVIGPRPSTAMSLAGYPQCDAMVQQLAGELWGPETAGPAEHKYGSGRVIAGRTAREVLSAGGILPDCDGIGIVNGTLNYIHRRTADADIYFVANRSNQTVTAACTFRVKGLVPELWNAVTGEHRFALAYQVQPDGRITVPLQFDPCGSWFVVFRAPAAQHPPTGPRNFPEFTELQPLDADWTVAFDPKWGGPESAAFPRLVSWTTRPEPGIKYYSGTAVYRKTFTAPALPAGREVWLDLGQVDELAEVKVNGQSCGIVWTPPFRVRLTPALHSGANQLEVAVVNFWPNRIIGDAALPPAQRRTRTNIRKLTTQTSLMDSGLLGPVRLLTPKE